MEVPAGSQVGERVTLENQPDLLAFPPLDPNKVKKAKVWEGISAGLKTSATGAVTFNGSTVVTSAGACLAPTVLSGDVR